MALNDSRPPLERAVAAAQEHRPRQWEQVSATIMARVRAVRSGTSDVIRATLLDAPAEGGVSRTHVSTLVLRDRLREGLRHHDHVLSDVKFGIEDDHLVRLELSLACRFGADLRSVGARAHALADSILDETLGPADPRHPRTVEVTVVDVTEGDPRLT